MVNTNLLSPIRLTQELLPILRKQPSATIITVSSGLAFIPKATNPTYCATKAALHSYTEFLRRQLRETAIQVIELIPPYVATNLQGERQANDPHAMPLGENINETMEILKTHPETTEVLVERVRQLGFAAENGQEKYDELFQQRNAGLAANELNYQGNITRKKKMKAIVLNKYGDESVLEYTDALCCGRQKANAATSRKAAIRRAEVKEIRFIKKMIISERERI